MINTIFYFPSSLTFLDYTTMLNSGEIAERTVVFADAQKAIYKGGKKYGGLSDQEFHDLIDSLEHDSWISDEISSVKGDIHNANTRIDSVNSSVTDVNNRLTSAISSRDSDITSKVENLFKDSQWLQQNFPQGQTSWDSDWNSELESYLTQVGYWDIDSTTGQKTAKWSKLQNDVDSISLEIANLTGNETSSQSLTTAIESMIEDDIAALNLNTTYASVSDVNNAKSILEWLYSGLKASSGQDKTFTELSSMTKSAFTSAISDIRTQVDKVANGDFVAQTEVSAKVGNAISTMLAQASGDNALATLAAKADTNSDNIASLVLGMTGSTSTANLSTSVSTALNNLTSGLASSSDITSAKSEIYSAISAKDSNDNFISLAALKTQSDADHATVTALASNGVDTSGFVAKSELGTAVASLFASTGDAQNPTAKANVVAVVKDNKSALNLTAQDVNIDGYLTAGNATFKGDVEATSFTTGASNEVGITVLAGEFDPTDPNVNTHKAYFAYDSDLGGITMWFYCDNVWKRIDLASASVTEDPNTFVESLLYTGTLIGTYLLQDNTNVPKYYSRLTGKYYSTTSATTANLLTATGYEFPNNWYPSEITFFSNNPTGTNGMVSTKWDAERGFFGGHTESDSDYSHDVCYFLISNVPNQLNLHNRPLYLFAPVLGKDFNGGSRMSRLVIQDGEIQSSDSYYLHFVCDTVLWHAAGDPLPDGIIPQSSQTPSVNDAFAYAVWRIGDFEYINNASNSGNGDVYIGGGDGLIYSATATGNYQITRKAASLSNYGTNYKGYSYGGNKGPLSLNEFSKSTLYGLRLDPSRVSNVARIWHTIPTYSYVNHTVQSNN